MICVLANGEVGKGWNGEEGMWCFLADILSISLSLYCCYCVHV